ncbi:MFS transporter [Halorarum salinum]|uniref:MFS transporter n=1 Tax=Halorarum salinum TaxID=2743089 RepID=A0A7D5L846_9EURY|nr:MFS transporter [Halobaculum salinum]QLG60288.1 MFS transporter [Halobaculum salinum]
MKYEVKTTLGAMLSDGMGWILLGVTAGWALSLGMRFVFPALLPFLQSEFRIDLATSGLLLTVLWSAYAIGHIPGGVLGDRIGEGNTLVLSTIISTGTVLVIMSAINVSMLFVGTFIFGIATALYGPTRFTILTDLYSKKAGTAIGLTMAGGSLGSATFPVITTMIAVYLSWRHGFGLFLVLFAIVAVGLRLTVPQRTSPKSNVVNQFSRETLDQLVKGISRESILTVVMIQVCISFIMQGFSSFYPSFLVDMRGISPGVASSLFGGFFIIGAIVQPLAGNITDRFGAKWTLTGLLGVSASGLWLLLFVEEFVALVLVTILISTLNGCYVVTQTKIADTLPTDLQGTGLGSLKAGWMLLGATSPLIIGVLASGGHFRIGYVLLAVIGTGGMLISLLRL